MRNGLGISVIIAVLGWVCGCYSVGPAEVDESGATRWPEGSDSKPAIDSTMCPAAYYSLELPSSYGRATEAVALNNGGQIIGEIHAGDALSTPAEPVLWSLAGPHPSSATIELIDQGEDWFGFSPHDINDHGEVVGGAYSLSEVEKLTELPVHGIFWSKEAGMIEVGPDLPMPVVAINNNGWMVGHAWHSAQSGARTVCFREFSIWPGLFEGSFGICMLESENSGSFNSFSAFINNADAVAGHSTGEDGSTQPYRQKSGEPFEPFLVDGYDHARVTDLNDQHQMVGSVREQLQSPEAVIWDADNRLQVLDLSPGWTDVTSSEASAVNNNGLVVGTAWGASTTRGWLRCGEETYDLADLVVSRQDQIVSVDDINDHNWIIAHKSVSVGNDEEILKAMVLIPF